MRCTSSSWAARTSSSARKRRRSSATSSGVIGKVGLEAGKKVISMRRRLRELIAYFGGKVDASGAGPARRRQSKGLKPEDLPQFKQLAKDGARVRPVDACRSSRRSFLKNPDYVKLITSDAYTHRTCYMGMVDEQNKVNFYDGQLRVVDCQRQGVCEVSRPAVSRLRRRTRRAVELHEVQLSQAAAAGTDSTKARTPASTRWRRWRASTSPTAWPRPRRRRPTRNFSTRSAASRCITPSPTIGRASSR